MRSRWVQSVAYVLLALAIAAGALAFAVLHAWESPHYAGAAPGYRHIVLGYQHADGANYTTFASSMLPALIAHLPPHWRVGMQFPNEVAFGPQAGPHLAQIKTAAVLGDFLQALRVRPLAGRLITLQEQRTGAPVIVLSQGLAQRWFGSPGAAIGRTVHGGQGQALSVIGVLPAAFTGIEGIFSSHPVQAWVPGTLLFWLSSGQWPFPNGKPPKKDLLEVLSMDGFAPLLGVPKDVSDAQLHTVLARAFSGMGQARPADASGFAWTTPYSQFPSALQMIAQRIRLFLGLAIAALVLASINVLVLRWLGYLRRRNTLQLERVLGARRGWLLRRLLLRGLLTALALLLASIALIVLGVLLLLHLAADVMGSVLGLHSLLLPLAWMLPAIVLLVMLVELLPLLLLLGRERLDDARTVSAGRGDRAFGAALLAGEVLLGMVMSALAAWAIGYAWQATHQPLGVLDRPARFASLHDTSNLIAEMSAKPSLQAAQARVQAALATAAAALPAGRALGFGPLIGPGALAPMPHAMTAGTRTLGACTHHVTPGWISAAGVRVLAGENFSAAHAVPATALVDARVAQRLFGSVPAAVGRTFLPQGAEKPLRILGVVAPVDLAGSRKHACPVVFEDLRNSMMGLLVNPHSLAIAGTLDGAQQAALHQRLGALFEREHLSLRLGAFRSTGALRDELAAQQITQSHVFIAIALLAWAIALSGIVALLRLYLAQRRRVQAIASALGATPTRTYREVLLGTLLIALIGALLAYLLLPWLATQYALLSGAQVAPYGWPTWIALLVLLAAVFLVAHFPARRAARAEPAASLHEL